MKTLMTVTGYFLELKAVLISVNRQVWGIDPWYVAYSWIAEAFSYLTNVAPFLFVVIGVGYVIETPELSSAVVLVGVGVFTAYLAVKSILESWSDERRSLFDNLLSTRLELSYIEHLATLDLGRLTDPAFIKLARLAESRGKQSVKNLWESQKNLVGATVAVLAFASLLLTLDWVIGILAIFMAAPAIAKRWFSEQKLRELDEMETLIYRQRSTFRDAISDPEMAILTRLLKLTKPFFSRYFDLTDILKTNVYLLARFQKWWDLFVGFTMLVCIVVFGLYFSSGLVAGRYTLVEIGGILTSLRLITFSIQQFGWSLGQIGKERKDYGYLEEFFQTRPLVDECGCRPIILAATPELKFNDLTFAYPRQTKNVINGISFTIAPGEKSALVGPNGCCKTTLLRLTSKVYVSKGSIWAGQHRLDEMLQDSWLRHVVMITQSASLSGMEIARAITGQERAKADLQRLNKALAFAGADSIVSELPLGLDTWIGEEWPNGKGFSPGERKRFILAAAFYQLLCPQVFIALFDEPTESCDAETKAKFYQAITQAPEFVEKTILVSLHDPLYLHFFDRVLQFESGRLVNDLRGPSEIEAYQGTISLALAQDL